MAFRAYQDIAFDHFAQHPRCALWAGMGLGKTYVSSVFNEAIVREDGGPNIVFGPKRVCKETWPDEARKWGLPEPSVIIGTVAQRRAAMRQPADLFAVNYENIPWLIDELDGKWPYRGIFADESTKLKGYRLKHGGKRMAQLAKVAYQSAFFKELSGTPATNGLKDLWGQMWFLDKGQRLGRTYTAFTERWFRVPYSGYGLEPLPFAFQEITERCKDICLSIDAADWFDLEKPIVSDIYVDLPPAARALYRELEKDMFAQLKDRSVTAVNAAVKSGKLLQVASGAVYIDPLADEDHGPREWKEVHDAKLDALDSILEEQAGAPLLVAYQFRSDLARLRSRYPSARTIDSPNAVADWNDGKIAILLLHPASAGHGLNLQFGGNAIAFFSQTWNLEHRLQIIERIGPTRQAQAGFRRPVFIYNIIARDTMDEVVIARNSGNKSVLDALMAYMKRKLK